MRYITIEREYGSGGTKIARELAKKCGVPCYGQEILERASLTLDMPVEEIRENEEKTTSSMLYGLFLISQVTSGNSNLLSKDGQVFVEEQRAIKELAAKGSAVFLGHCATEALKEYDDVIQVYIYADAETKKKRMQEDYGIAENQAESIAKKNNKRRSNYYYSNTHKKWDDLRNYDIALDSSKLGMETCVEILCGCFKK